MERWQTSPCSLGLSRSLAVLYVFLEGSEQQSLTCRLKHTARGKKATVGLHITWVRGRHVTWSVQGRHCCLSASTSCAGTTRIINTVRCVLCGCCSSLPSASPRHILPPSLSPFSLFLFFFHVEFTPYPAVLLADRPLLSQLISQSRSRIVGMPTYNFEVGNLHLYGKLE